MILEIRYFLTGLTWPISIIVPKFVPMCQTVAEICPFVVFSRWRSSGILEFQVRNFPPDRFKEQICVIKPNFAPIDQTVAEIWLLFDFFKAMDNLPTYVTIQPDNIPSNRLYDGDLQFLITCLNNMKEKLDKFSGLCWPPSAVTWLA